MIALQTLFGERVERFWRNVILTIPTTLAMGLLFVGLAKSPQDVSQVALIHPAALGPDYLFIATFALLSKFNLAVSLLGGIVVYMLSATFLLLYPPASFITSIFLYGIPMIIVGYLLIEKLPQVTRLKTYPINFKHVFLRAILGGSVVMGIVLMSKTLGNVWSGIFSAFPASFSSSLIIYYLTQGKSVIPNIAKSLFFPGAIGFTIYAWIAAITFPTWGIWLGTLASYVGTFLFFWLASFMKEKTLV